MAWPWWTSSTSVNPAESQVLREFVEGERAAAFGADEHVDGEQGPGRRLGLRGIHHDVPDDQRAPGCQGGADLAVEEPVLAREFWWAMALSQAKSAPPGRSSV